MNEKTMNRVDDLMTPTQDEHEIYNLLMSLALDEMLSPNEEADLHQHLAQCPACAGTWAAWFGLHERFVAEPAALPAVGFGERFELRRLQQVRRRRLWMGSVVAFMAMALWGTLLLVGLVAANYFLNNPTGTLPQVIYQFSYTWSGLVAAAQVLWRGLTVAMTTSNLPLYMGGYTILALAIVTMWTNYLRRTFQPIAAAGSGR
jgi:hypothetical protein